MSNASLRPLAPVDRIAAIVDANSVMPVDAALALPRASPHLARWGIAAQDDDGIVLARATVHGRAVLVAAQDEHFLGGSVGARHGEALGTLFERARVERPAAVVLLLASGGVRLHEANAAELALARALSRLLDARAAGIPVLALCVGDVFGGASVMACATDRLAMLPGTRLGLSGPRLIELAHGRDELDANDHHAVSALFGAEARAAAGQVELLTDEDETVRAWIAFCARGQEPFAAQVTATHARLGGRLAAAAAASAMPAIDPPGAPQRLTSFIDTDAVDLDRWLWKVRGQPVWITRSPGACSFGPREAHALDDALLARFVAGEPNQARTLIVVEDSAGHEATRSAEGLCVAQYLAQHAAVLALLRARGLRLIGLLAGVGHSAAFFANALQAPTLYALERARVIAMDPAAIARVTGLDSGRLAALIEDDSLLGQPVRCFARWGGVADLVAGVDDAMLAALAART